MNMLLTPPKVKKIPARFFPRTVTFIFAGSFLLMHSLLAAFFPPPDNSNPNTYPHKGFLTGQVQLPNGTPDNTRVRLWQYARGSVDVMLPTNLKGEFQTNQLPFGRYWVIVRDKVVGDVEITNKKPSVQIKVTAPPYVTLKGSVRDKKTGKPISRALVVPNMRSKAPQNWKYPVLGNKYEWAQYSVDDLAKSAFQAGVPHVFTNNGGQYEIKLPPRAALFAFAPDKDNFPATWTLNSYSGAKLTHDFELDRTSLHLIKGHIKLPNGKPYANSQAKFYLRRHLDVIHDITTDANGDYEFLPKDSFYDTQWLEVAGFAPIHQHAPLDKGPPFANIDWPLKHVQEGTGTLVASVLRDDGKTPFPDGFQVNYMRDYFPGWEEVRIVKGKPEVFYHTECGGASSGSLTVQDGIIRGNLEPGYFRLYAKSSPLTSREAPKDNPSWCGPGNVHDLSDNGHDAIFLSHVTIEPGKTTAMKFVHPKLSAVTVTLKKPDGTPYPKIKIACKRWIESLQTYRGVSFKPTTTPQGQVLFDPVPPGKYVFYPVAFENNKEILTPRYSMTLEAGKVHHLDMVMAETKGLSNEEKYLHDGEVSGKVFLPNGKTPAAFAAIYQTPGNKKSFTGRNPLTFTNADGVFRLTNQKHGAAMIWGWGDESAPTGVPVTISKKTKPVHIILDRAASVSGRVLVKDKLDLENISVALLSEPENRITLMPDHEWSFKFWSDGPIGLPVGADGAFSLHGIKPGKQYLCVYRDGLLLQDSILPLDIKAGENRKDVILTLEPGVKLQVHFQTADKKDLSPRLTAHLYSEYGSLFSCGGMEIKGNIAQSKRALPPGKYHLWLDWPYYMEKTADTPVGYIYRNLIIKPGQDLQKVEIPLPNPAFIKGRVVMSKSKNPVGGLMVRVHVPNTVIGGYLDPPLPLILDTKQPPSFGFARTAPDGTFNLFGLAPGQYRLSIHQEWDTPPLFIRDSIQVQEGKATDIKPVVLQP